jgi:hypothetical protein
VSEQIPSTETRLVRVEYNPEPKYLSETYGVLAPGPGGEQTLFVHPHLVRDGALPWVNEVVDAETGETIRVSGSWLGGSSQAAGERRQRERFLTPERKLPMAVVRRLVLFSCISVVLLVLGVALGVDAVMTSASTNLYIAAVLLVSGGALATLLVIAFHPRQDMIQSSYER